MTHQIRVNLSTEAYNKLKEQSQRFKLTLSQIATIKLSGYDIVSVLSGGDIPKTEKNP